MIHVGNKNPESDSMSIKSCLFSFGRPRVISKEAVTCPSALIHFVTQPAPRKISKNEKVWKQGQDVKEKGTHCTTERYLQLICYMFFFETNEFWECTTLLVRSILVLTPFCDGG